MLTFISPYLLEDYGGVILIWQYNGGCAINTFRSHIHHIYAVVPRKFIIPGENDPISILCHLNGSCSAGAVHNLNSAILYLYLNQRSVTYANQLSQ